MDRHAMKKHISSNPWEKAKSIRSEYEQFVIYDKQRNEFLSSLSHGQYSEINFYLNEKFNLTDSKTEDNGNYHKIIDEISSSYNKDRFNLLIDDCKKSTLSAIIKPFGLAGMLFKDKVGGNVTTLFNFENGIVASEEDEERYQSYISKLDRKKDYDPEFNKIKNIIKDRNASQGGNDDYTGLPLEGIIHVDHVVPIGEINKMSSVHLYLDQANRSSIANDPINLKVTNGPLNSSKNDKTMGEFLYATPPGAPAGITNIDRFGIDENSALLADKNAREFIEKKIREERNIKIGIELSSTGIAEGINMGIQQALGLLLYEFSLATFDEISSIIKSKNDFVIDKQFILSLKHSLEIIANRVISKFDRVVACFSSGFISGFFSNIITFIINQFTTTSARMVRIIREGFYSLLNGLKLLFVHPTEMHMDEAIHESSKIIASGVIIGSGLAIEEMLQKSLMTVPLIGAFSNLISPVIMGIISGLLVACTIYIIDKTDIFGVVEDKKKENILNKLDGMVNSNMLEIENGFKYILNEVN